MHVNRYIDWCRRNVPDLLIAGLTLGLLVILLTALPAGRYLAGWLATHGQWTALRMIGLEPDREEIDAEWQRKRTYNYSVFYGWARRRGARFVRIDCFCSAPRPAVIGPKRKRILATDDTDSIRVISG